MDYPWYATAASGEPLEQGDLIEGIELLRLVNAETNEIGYEEFDLIVMTQSCDLRKEDVEHVALCPVWPLEEISNQHLRTPKGKNDLRRGIVVGYHLLNMSTLSGFKRDFRVVEFRRVIEETKQRLRDHVAKGPRLRLLPPYREHLAQAFARSSCV
jgi:hypothetical protein